MTAGTLFPYLSGVDRATLNAVPVLVMPNDGELERLERGRSRFVLASNGLFLECLTHALYARLCVEPFVHHMRLPFGECQPRFELAGGPIPVSMLQEIVERGRASCPNEYAAHIYWTEGGYRLVEPEVDDASPASIRYKRTAFDTSRLVLDVHTHGTGSAYFSATDNLDDMHEPAPLFLSSVLGQLGEKQKPAAALRVVLNGRFFGSGYKPWSGIVNDG